MAKRHHTKREAEELLCELLRPDYAVADVLALLDDTLTEQERLTKVAAVLNPNLTPERLAELALVLLSNEEIMQLLREHPSVATH